MSNIGFLVKWPNLGHPCLVPFLDANKDVAFSVIFAGRWDTLDLKSLLKDKLFLQSLQDTQEIQKDGLVLNVDGMGNYKQNLIPLQIEKVENPTKSSWHWFDEEFYWDFKVTLKIESKYINNLKIPQLFNLIHDFPETPWYNVNFHSVYIHKKDWCNFRFIHMTDTHIALRNEEIKFVISKRMGKPPGGKDRKIINFNDVLRDLIKVANQLHRKGELDFILLTGDIIDYVWENYSGRRPHEERLLYNNFEYFAEIIRGKGGRRWNVYMDVFNSDEHYTLETPTGEELEVPIFTVLGNHDYRLNEYPLISKIHWDTAEVAGPLEIIISFIPGASGNKGVNQYGGMKLSKDEAIAYEKLYRVYHYKMATYFVEHSTDLPQYSALINPDRYYAIELGKHKIVLLDTSHDEGIFDSVLDYMSMDESQKDFVESNPDSVGFSKEQINYLEKQIKGTKGLVIIAFHAPIINIRGNKYVPHHLMRETEHKKLNSAEAQELEDFIIKMVEKWEEYLKWPKLKTEFCPEGWEKMGYFKNGPRDPYLSQGVADHRFEEFVDTIFHKIGQNKKANLILSGHTHHSIEYRISERSDGVITYFHDYYIDNTLDGNPPTRDSYPNPLNTTAMSTKDWWLQHSPLIVQTLSLGPEPKIEKDGGYLLITVKNDTITKIERRYIRTERELDVEEKEPTNHVYIILASSPP